MACIPTYQVDGSQPISETRVFEPTQGCRPCTAHLLPSLPALAVDQRQATRRGTGLMNVAARPSLSSSNPRVQFWQMLFPADKVDTNSFCFAFPIRGLRGEGRVSSSKIRDFSHCSGSSSGPWVSLLTLHYYKSVSIQNQWSDINTGYLPSTKIKTS